LEHGGTHTDAGASQSTYFEYDQAGNLTKQTDAEGEITTFEYNAFGQVTKTTDPEGNVITNNYDQRGRLITTTDALGYMTYNTYNSFGELIEERRIADESVPFELSLDPNQYVNESYGEEEDYRQLHAWYRQNVPTGLYSIQIDAFQYEGFIPNDGDEQRSKISVHNADTGEIIASSWISNEIPGESHWVVEFELSETTNISIKRETNTEDNKNTLNITNFEISPFTASLDPNQYVNESHGEEEYYREVHAWYSQNVPAGQHAIYIDAFQYEGFDPDDDDEQSSLIGVYNADTGELIASRLISNEIPGESHWVVEFELSETTNISIKQNTLNITKFEISPNWSELSGGAETYAAYSYDKLGRLVQSKNALGEKTNFSYTAFGQQSEVTNALGAETFYTYNDLGQLTESRVIEDVHDHTGALVASEIITRFEYDSRGNQTKQIAAYGLAEEQTTVYAYDDLDRLVRMEIGANPSASSFEASFDPNQYVDESYGEGEDYQDVHAWYSQNVPAGQHAVYIDAFQYEGVFFDPNDDDIQSSRIEVYDADTGERIASNFISNRIPGESSWVVEFELSETTNISIKPIKRHTDTEDNKERLGITKLEISPRIDYIYDLRGNMIESRDENGGRTLYYYDKLDRVTHEINAVGTLTRNFYDANSNLIETRVYLTQVTLPIIAGGIPPEGTGEYSLTYFEYDRLNQMTESRVVLDTYNDSGVLAGRQNVTQYEYDGRGLQTKVIEGYRVNNNTTDAVIALRSTTSVYDESGRLIETRGDSVSVFDSVTGNTSTQTPSQHYVYDARGNVVETIDAEGARSLSWYDKLDRVIATVGAEGTLTRNFYDAIGNLTLVRVYSDTYSDVNALVTGGNPPAALRNDFTRTSFTYDNRGQMLSTTSYLDDGTGITSSYVYDANGNVTQEIDARNSRIHSYYNARNLLTHQVDAENYLTVFEYDAVGNVIQQIQYATSLNNINPDTPPTPIVDNNRDQITLFAYDKASRLIRSLDAEGYLVVTGYDSLGNADEITRFYTATSNINANTYFLAHDNDATSTYNFDNQGRLITATDPLGASIYEAYKYDALGQQVEVRNKAGGITRFSYDERGLMTESRVALNTYDENGALIGRQNVISYAYDARGLQTKVVEGYRVDNNTNGAVIALRTTISVYDDAGRVLETKGDAVHVYESDTDITGIVDYIPTQSYTYDARGNVIEMLDALGARTLTYYDKLDRVIATVSAEGTFTRSQYDRVGNLKEVRVYETQFADVSALIAGGNPPNEPSSDFRVTEFSYDKLGRMLESKVPSILTGEFNGIFSVETNNLETVYQYDAFGNVIKQTDPNGHTINYGYDQLNRKTSQVDQEGYGTVWFYDVDGNVLTEKRYANKTTKSPIGNIIHNDQLSAGGFVLPSGTDRITTFTYNKAGQRKTETREAVEIADSEKFYNSAEFDTINQDVKIEFTYNALGQVQTRTEATGDVTTYNYDNQGRLTSEVSQSYIGHTGLTVTPTTEIYYDALGEVAFNKQLGAHGVAARQTKYIYDGAGRLESMIDPTGFQVDYFYNKNGQVIREEFDRITNLSTTPNREARAFTYDLEGRVISQTILQWSGTQWNEGDTSDTDYNAFGEVERQGVNGNYSTLNVYDDGGRIWRTTGGDGTNKFFIYDKNGNQTVSISSDGTNLDNKTLSQVLGLWGVSANGDYANKLVTDYVDGITATITEYNGRNLATYVYEPRRELEIGTLTDLETERAYNAFGDVISETDVRGNTIEYTYNSAGRRTSIISPEVTVTATNGTTSSTRPTEYIYYDASGRLVASKDANGNLSRQEILAGTGYEDSEVSIARSIAADGGVKTQEFDALGNLRTVIDEIGRTSHQYYDDAGRIIQIDHAGGLKDYFGYDGLGNQISHYNNELESGNKELTDYDQEGRVISQRAFGGDITTNSYTWIGSLTTSGLGSFGGWEQNTTYANSRVNTQTKDVFGRVTSTNDLGGYAVNFNYNKAGQLIKEDGTGAEDKTYTWLNTGSLSTQTGLGKVASFGYDASGNLTSETLKQGTQFIKNVNATYDALGRLTTWEDLGGSYSYQIREEGIFNRNFYFKTETVQTPEASKAIGYDANGNIILSVVSHERLGLHGEITNANGGYTRSYAFDSMNRVVREGAKYFEYDKAGQRVSMEYGFGDSAVVSSQDVEEGNAPYNELHYTIYFTNKYREEYKYNDAGHLTEVHAGEGRFNQITDYADVFEDNVHEVEYSVVKNVKLRADHDYDLLGRTTLQRDFASNGYTVAYSNITEYNAKSQVTSTTSYTLKDDNVHRAITTNIYGTDTSYALGQVTYSETATARTGSIDRSNNSDNYDEGYGFTKDENTNATRNTYTYAAGAQLSRVDHEVEKSEGFNPNYNPDDDRSDYFYERAGSTSSLSHVDVEDKRDRGITYVNDLSGQVVRRIERDDERASDEGDPNTVYYNFSGKQIGTITNNGTSNITYVDSIAERTDDSSDAWAFRNGDKTHSPYGEFDGSYAAVNSYHQGSQSGSYTVNGGETLSSIAASLYGDRSLWYKIGQANGISSANAALIEGQTLRLPTGVIRNTHNAETFKPYSPGEAIGDTAPTAPQPGKGKGCGIVGQIIIVAVAVAVTVLTAGALGPAATTLGAIAIGATSAAAGSVASQIVGVATGIQEKFSFKAVALAALSGGVGAGLGPSANIFQAAIKGAAGSAITQGIGVATGLQDKFSFAGVAAAGIAAGVSFQAGKSLGLSKKVVDSGKLGKDGAPLGHFEGDSGNLFATPESTFGKYIGNSARSLSGGNISLDNIGRHALRGASSAIASAATRSALDGSNFGQNIKAAIPDVIGSVIGEAVYGRCFAAGTLVHSEKGLIPIEDIKAGDSEQKIKKRWF